MFGSAWTEKKTFLFKDSEDKKQERSKWMLLRLHLSSLFISFAHQRLAVSGLLETWGQNGRGKQSMWWIKSQLSQNLKQRDLNLGCLIAVCFRPCWLACCHIEYQNTQNNNFLISTDEGSIAKSYWYYQFWQYYTNSNCPVPDTEILSDVFPPS